MADTGHEPVMRGGIHHDRVSANRVDEAANDRIGACEDPRRALEEVRIRSVNACGLAAAHGMTADEVDTLGCRPLHHPRLRARHVGDDLGRDVASQRFEHLGHGKDRNRHHDHICHVDGAEVAAGNTGDASIHRLAHGGRVVVEADDRHLWSGLLHRHRERGAHQAQAYHADSRHWP